MVKLSTVSTLLVYHLQSISYKPVPGNTPAAGSSYVSPFPSSDTSHQDLTKTTNNRLVDSEILDVACNVVSYNGPPVLDQEFPPYERNIANVYRYRQQQSVNLGSWFVHEKWMTPSLFTCASGTQGAEIDIAYGWQSPTNARAVLERHWDTFITEADFQYLSSIGINTVRLPIGYWNLGPQFMQGTAFEWVSQVYQNSWFRVVRAINQAGKAGIGVIVDLHGAVGSQNGQQHSGVSDGKTALFSDPGNMDKTIAVLTFLTQQLAPVNNVVGIQVLNEPVYDPGLENFYSRAMDAMRGATPFAENLPLYLHDGFDLDRFSTYVTSRKDFVVLDHHSYFVFTPSDAAESGTQHTKDVKGAIAKWLGDASNRLRGNLIIGEWSCGLTPQSLENEQDADQVSKRFCEEQMKVYANATAGWAFWSYKKEECSSDPGWCFKTAVGRSLPSSFNSKIRRSTSGHSSSRANDDATGNLVVDKKAKFLLKKRLHNPPDQITGSHSSILAPRRHQRSGNIHQRDPQLDQSAQSEDTDPAQKSFSKGYSDGLSTAKTFASYNNSRLGFLGQFMQDTIGALGSSVIAPGTEENYKQGFIQGLAEGEAASGVER